MFVPINNSKGEDISYKPNNKIEATDNKETIQTIEFLKSISGLKAKNIELIDNPVGIKGEFLAPKESILNGVDYFLKHTENDKMTNVKVDIGDSYIAIRVDYKITKSIATPIEVKIIPTLNNNKDLENIETIVVVTNKQKLDFKSDKIIKLVPKDIVLGVGCKKNTDSQHMKESLHEFSRINNIDINSIKKIGSIEIKKDEKAIIDLANYLNVPFETFTVKEISQIDHLYGKSEWVKKNVGVYSVAEPCAHLLSDGNLIIEKQKYTGITFSAGRVNK